MAKTITRLEPSDISIENDPLHKRLFTTLLVTLLLQTGPSRENESREDALKRNTVDAIVLLLNMLNEAGYVITKREDIPASFIGGE